MHISIHGIDVRLASDCGAFTPSLNVDRGDVDGVYHATLQLDSKAALLLPDLKLAWDLPAVDFHYKWNPRCGQNRALDVGLGSFNHIQSAAHNGAPVFSLYNLAGINACTWALSDVVHETSTGGAYKSGQTFYCDAKVVGNSVGIVTRYVLTIRFDFRRIPYYEAITDISRYWEGLPGCAPCTVPAAARKPLLSSWYVYEIRFDPDDFEAQCRIAAETGFETAIMDDGWQTSQTTAGYENNGDWEVCKEKVPDLESHVARVHAMGMKYMAWFAVPLVGVQSKAFHRFKAMLLPGREGAKWYSFDMRFPEVREYLIERFESFVSRYRVDGLKLDFIDSCNDTNPGSAILEDGRRDCVSIGEGMCKLLGEAKQRLCAINPGILIEFRQGYTGPAMRTSANMLRAVDCANSLGDNRVRTLDLRLLAGSTAVHSDPITWNKDEPVHSAAMQIIHALFSVPQISMRLSDLPDAHRKMLRWQLAFCKSHEDVLQSGAFRPLYPHLLYPLVVARNAEKMVIAFYADMPMRIGDEALPADTYLVNGSYASELLLAVGQTQGRAFVTVMDCCGVRLRIENIVLSSGLHRFTVPPAGHVHLRCFSDETVS